MKALIVAGALIISLSVSGSALAQHLTTPRRPGEPNCAPSQACVRIQLQWYVQKGNVVQLIRIYSLGTAVRPNVILTHNHFDQPAEALRNEAMTFTDSAGRALEVAVADLALVPVDPGTMLIYLPANVVLNGALAGSRSNAKQPASGDWLTVNYWDDRADRFTQRRFQVIESENGVATVADPQHHINPGDSGGGVYFEGALTGNTWSMNTSNGKLIGTFNVALLPERAMGMLQESANSQEAADLFEIVTNGESNAK